MPGPATRIQAALQPSVCRHSPVQADTVCSRRVCRGALRERQPVREEAGRLLEGGHGSLDMQE